jgi:hypothetical protein
VERAIRLFEQRFHDQVTIKEAARVAGLSPDNDDIVAFQNGPPVRPWPDGPSRTGGKRVPAHFQRNPLGRSRLAVFPSGRRLAAAGPAPYVQHHFYVDGERTK